MITLTNKNVHYTIYVSIDGKTKTYRYISMGEANKVLKRLKNRQEKQNYKEFILRVEDVNDKMYVLLNLFP